MGTHWGAAPASASWGGGFADDQLTNDPSPCSATKDFILCAVHESKKYFLWPLVSPPLLKGVVLTESFKNQQQKVQLGCMIFMSMPFLCQLPIVFVSSESLPLLASYTCEPILNTFDTGRDSPHYLSSLHV